MSEPGRKVYLAVDLGASSGRVMAGEWNDGKLSLKEVNRFKTPSVKIGRYWHWDILSIYSSVEEGLRKAVQRYGESVVSVGVDTWGVDYGLLDEEGELLANPICYRDSRTEGVSDDLHDTLSKERIYAETGIDFMFFNTLYQHAAEARDGRTAYLHADRALFLPDLINFWLSGVKATERTIASTSQMLNPKTGDWSEPLLEAVGVSRSLLGKIVEPGTRLGPIQASVQESLGSHAFEVVAAPGHDTASAFMALSGNEPDYGILSSGTWSLMGVELQEPNCSLEAMDAGLSNEIGYGRSVRFLTNICGMWLLEESLRQWRRKGQDLEYSEIAQLTREAEPMACFFDPDDPVFSSPGDMPQRIVDYCKATGQPAPSSVGQVARSIFDSLALKYRFVFEKLQRFAPRPLKGLHILGGGSRNEQLNQMTADALGVPVYAGPSEATAIGNICSQLIANKELADLASAREMVKRSFAIERFEPNKSSLYEEASKRFAKLLDRDLESTRS
ncbi:rhamnulokinase family protein [Pelagicoccus sp. SDUM812003]|uniref:rhamnulokinase n=1 Tax=Pelagicoccus sp. SDUM812003 TaxID=3041267 RepID=UPI00280F69C3|nr:rhamnulokinase family protein [Pelagicoccus sp. SDUM812003]MDQ8204627.1 rhamnulokinase [Pelagicoccus sp. SDUM812003]